MLAEASTTSRRTARVQTSTALLLIELFNGKPLASLIDFTFALPVKRNRSARGETNTRERRRIGAIGTGKMRSTQNYVRERGRWKSLRLILKGWQRLAGGRRQAHHR
jgi:hypothetical protein